MKHIKNKLSINTQKEVLKHQLKSIVRTDKKCTQEVIDALNELRIDYTEHEEYELAGVVKDFIAERIII